jgi:cobalt-zinc-cadmium efflux system protein
MSHGHSHSHGEHEVGDGALLSAVVLNVGLSVFEFIAGAVSGSVALMADAAHNTNDAASLLIAYVARRISRKGADHRYTFGYRRAELIGAMIQLTALILVGLFLVVEAGKRFWNPEPPLAGWMMAAAGVALVVDVGTALLLWAMSKGSLNVRAAFLHNLTDAAASLAVLLGGAAVWRFGWSWVDPALTLVIAGYILWMSVGLLRRTAAILMETAPPDLDSHELIAAVEAMDGVLSLHHLHVWELDEHHVALEAHVVVEVPDTERMPLRNRIKDLLHDGFNIGHSTLELEAPGEDCRGEGGC